MNAPMSEAFSKLHITKLSPFVFWIIVVVIKLVLNPSSLYEDPSVALHSQTNKKHEHPH